MEMMEWMAKELLLRPNKNGRIYITPQGKQSVAENKKVFMEKCEEFLKFKEGKEFNVNDLRVFCGSGDNRAKMIIDHWEKSGRIKRTNDLPVRKFWKEV